MAQSIFKFQQYPSEQFVESCGAILFDLSDLPTTKVCLINVLEKQEWLLAKGRRNIGESRKDAALREVMEETGYQSHPLPVRMVTRACSPSAPANVSDKPRIHNNIMEPFMCTVRELPHGKGVKIIWWYIAVLDEDAVEQRGPGEKDFEAQFFSCAEAVEKLTFESDREVLRKALQIVNGTVAFLKDDSTTNGHQNATLQ